MYRIIDNRGTGKTSRLLLLAKENNGIVVCANPISMREKAHRYGLTGIECMSYTEFIDNIKEQKVKVPLHLSDGNIEIMEQGIKGTFLGKPVFVDEIDCFLNKLTLSEIAGDTLSNEE